MNIGDKVKVGAAGVELSVIDKTKEGFDKAKANAKREVQNIENSLNDVKIQLNTRIAGMQLKEVERFHKFLKNRLEEKIKLNVDSRSIERTKAEIQAVEEKLKSLRAASLGSKSSSKIGDLFSGAMGIELATAGLAAGAAAFGMIAIDAAKAYTEVEGVRNAFGKLNDPNILDKLREATRNTIADSELMQLSLKAVDKDVSFNNLIRIMELAKNKSSETGSSVEYLAEKLIDDIGNKSTSALENFGVSVNDLKDEIKNVGDYGEAAFNLLGKSINNMGFVADTNKDKLEQIYALIQNIKEALGGGVFDAISFLIKYSSPQNIVDAELKDAYEKAMKDFSAKQKQFNASVKSAQNEASKNTVGQSDDQLLNNIKIVQEKIKNIGEATTEEEKLKLEQLTAKLNVYKKAHEDLAPLLNPYKTALGEVEQKIKTLQGLQKNYAIGDSQYSKIAKEIERLDEIIHPKATKSLKENLLKSYYDTVKFEDKDYSTYRKGLIEKEVAEFIKATGDQVKAEEFKVKRLKELNDEYSKWLSFDETDLIQEDNAWLDEVIAKENELAKIRDENLQVYIDARNELSEEEKKELEERLKKEEEIHNLRMNAISEFGNALEGLSAHGKTFLSYFNAALQAALKISDALDTMKTDQLSGILGIASGGLGFITKLLGLKSGGSVTNFGGGNVSYQPHQKFAGGVNNFVVPPGYNRDNYLVGVQSGEKLNVTPANQTNGSSDNSYSKLIADRIGAMNSNMVELMNAQIKTNVNKVLEAEITNRGIYMSNKRGLAHYNKFH